VSDAVWLSEDDIGNGSVFVWGHVAWSWQAGDQAARKLAAVQLAKDKGLFRRQVAEAFSVNEDTLLGWHHDYERGGVESLVPQRPGPRGPSKLTEAKRAEIESLRDGGLTMAEVAEQAGVSINMVSRAMATRRLAPVAEPAPVATVLTPLARPANRDAERQAARAGLLEEAAPVICEGASLPMAGALVILPALVATGLLEVFSDVYRSTRAAFYGLRSLVLSVVFASLLGEPRAEGLTRLDPVDVGRLLGLDRVPEVRTLRRRTEELASLGRADAVIERLARRHLAATDEVSGVFYVDGHVRAYHGAREVQKAHVARIRLAMPAEVDTWVGDRNGDGLLVWSAEPSASLVKELKVVTAKIRELVGEGARPTICFDRGGWSPKLFKELTLAGFDILTYRKGPAPDEPRSAFAPHAVTDRRGRSHEYWLSDRPVVISYDAGRRRFACRQITRLDPVTGHQTQVLTTRSDEDPALLAALMFNRWSQENFFRYMRAHFALDALDTYATTDDDPERLVPNPERKDADRALAEARRSLARAEANQGRAVLDGRGPDTEILSAFAAARTQIDELAAAAKAIAATAPLATARPDMVRLAPERKRIMDAIRMATYNAESALARLLAPHYSRAHQEARSLLREVFKAPADLEVKSSELHVTINALSAPRRSRAVAALCADLSATKTLYPGTNLTLVYSVKDPR
jgi:transposase